MIKASELRIGNKFIGIAGVQTVCGIEENTDRGRCSYVSDEHRLMYSHLILCYENINQYKPCEIEPIPITAEWLVKFGFKLHSIDDATCSYVLEGTSIWVSLNPADRSVYHDWNTFKSVHHLQNFIFFKHGIELQDKPPEFTPPPTLPASA